MNKDSPHIINRSKVYKVALRPPNQDLKLNCSVIANPLATISWYYLPKESLPSKSAFDSLSFNHHNTNNNTSNLDNLLVLNSEWVSLNHIASYTIKYINDDNDLLNKIESSSEHLKTKKQTTSNNKLFSTSPPPTIITHSVYSKYHILERSINQNSLSSILIVKQASEKDSGVFKCLALNQLGNRTIHFKVESLNQIDHQKNSAESKSKSPDSVENRPKIHKTTKNRSKTNNQNTSYNSYNEYSSEYNNNNNNLPSEKYLLIASSSSSSSSAASFFVFNFFENIFILLHFLI
jgi:hypothetical protein